MYSSPVMLPNSQKPYRQSIFDAEPRLPESALFDKVINVAIHRRNKPDIIIRSDYELIVSGVANLSTVVLDDTMKQALAKEKYKGISWSIVRSTYKPSIQAKFTVLTQQSSDIIDLMIGNLFVFTGEGSMSLTDFMAKTEYDTVEGKYVDRFPITGFDILIGYASQFPKPVDPEDYFNVSVENAPLGVSALRVNDVDYCSYDKAAPNSVFRIHGYIGALSKVREDDYVYHGQTILMNTKKDLEPISISTPKSVFYNLVQRRFIRDKFSWDKARAYEEAKEQQKLKDKTQSFTNIFPKAKVPKFKIKQRYIDQDGYLNKEGADLFGCKIIIPKASALNKFKFDKGTTRDEEGNPIKLPASAYVNSSNTVEATLNYLNSKFFGNQLVFKQLLNGNYIAWLQSDTESREDAKEVSPTFPTPPTKYEFLSSLNEAVSSQMPVLDKELDEDTEEIKKREEAKINPLASEPTIIPAVYNIAVTAGKTVITCPFFNLVNPFKIVAFNSRYNLSDYSRFFAGKKRNQILFSVVNYTVDFSTTGKENMMTLLTVDSDLVTFKTENLGFNS